MSRKLVYKIMSLDDWQVANNEGGYTGSSDDKRDGFIHFSAKEQVAGTLSKHFAGQRNLLLLTIDTHKLKNDALKWEISRNGEKFPHLYGDLNLDAVIEVDEITDR